MASGRLTDLTSTITLDLAYLTAIATSAIALSPDGTQLAFDSRANHPGAGDTNGKSDVFLVDLVSREVSLLSTDSGNRQNEFPSAPIAYNPELTVAGFIADGVAFYVPSGSSLGEDGLYLKNLTDGTLSLIATTAETGLRPNGSMVPVSLSADGTKLAFTRTVGHQFTAVVRDVFLGTEQPVAVTGNGIIGNGLSCSPLISQNGSHVLFDSNATNLNRAARRGFQLYVKALVR